MKRNAALKSRPAFIFIKSTVANHPPVLKHHLSAILAACLLWQSLPAQSRYTPANVHAHNDYEQPIPFYAAFNRQAGSIEADIFLQKGELYVAHTPEGIQADRTLDALYLKPLQAAIRKNGGKVYAHGNDTLQVFIDLKTEGTSTMQALVRKLGGYPDITKNSFIRVVISGDVPPASGWEKYPAYFYFDGRPGRQYSPEQAKRIALVSDNFRKYTNWNGKGVIVQAERQKIGQLIDSVHRQGQKIRFWATPEGINAWKTLMRMGVDWLGTDQVTELTEYLRKLPGTE
jgi:alkaline phosphatase